MKKIIILSSLLAFLLLSTSCTGKNDKQTFWIYTSLYKDTINDIQPQLEKEFPQVKFQFYQAGSEEVASKVQAEILAGKVQADMLISSDRFWYEDIAQKGLLLAYQSPMTAKVDAEFKHPESLYNTLSFPVMVLAYNSEGLSEKEAPRSFKELADPKWKDKVSIASPLASGTSFTTIAFLVKKYGWDYIKDLRKNNLIAEGGNSGVVRRLQSKERPVGVVLMENILRLSESDPRIRWIIPTDGAVIQSNVLAIVKKENDGVLAKKVADWMFGPQGQAAMQKSFMYASVATGALEKMGNAPEFKEVLKSSQHWSRSFIDETMKSRESIKDQFSKIVF